jgi:hypothetical protein
MVHLSDYVGLDGIEKRINVRRSMGFLHIANRMR